MARRVLAALVVLGVALADATGDHRVAFYTLVAAIPPLAIVAMDAFGDYLEGGSGIRSLGWAVALALAVGRGRLEVEERVDVSAHAPILETLRAAARARRASPGRSAAAPRAASRR